MLELVLFAALAGVVLFQLYAVLGRRVGRQPEEVAKPGAARPNLPAPRAQTGEAEPETGVAALRSRDAAFDPAAFLSGAREAYVRIVRAFAAGERATLQGLTSEDVYRAFEAAMEERERAGRIESAEFLQPPRVDLENSTVAGDLARVRVRFLAEVRTRSKDASGEAVDDRRTAESWTFERPINSRDPNWTLVRVDAAES